MDLLGDLGLHDQLTSAREENLVLQAKVKELKASVLLLSFENESLKVENESLKAEVEIYREEAAAMPSSFSKMALGDSSVIETESKTAEQDEENEPFLRSGNGIYPKNCHVSLSNLHGAANLLTCALSPDDTVLATGGADATLSLCHWGRAYFDDDDDEAASSAAAESACRVPCSSPVIASTFCPTLPRVLACAGMDGSVNVIQYGNNNTNNLEQGQQVPNKTTLVAQSQEVCKHSKYVRCLAWSPRHSHVHSASILASASADGVIYLHKVERLLTTTMMMDDTDTTNEYEYDDLQITKLDSIHLQGSVESLCFVNDSTLVCYARNSPHLLCFDLATDLTLNNNGSTNSSRSSPRKIHLNPCESDSHVSFAVMDLATCAGHHGKYLAAATDTSRNIVLDFASGKQIRNLYGHANDGYSQPKLAWNCSGQYVLGNTQDESCVVVWDVASSQIVDRLGGAGSSLGGGVVGGVQRPPRHTLPIRDLYASQVSETLVTTSFDKKTNLWFFDDNDNNNPSEITSPSTSMIE